MFNFANFAKIVTQKSKMLAQAGPQGKAKLALGGGVGFQGPHLY